MSEFSKEATNLSNRIREISQRNVKNQRGRGEKYKLRSPKRKGNGELDFCPEPRKKCELKFYGDSVARVFCLAENPCWKGDK